MIALIERFKLAYVGIPKCGTLTMLRLAYRLDHGRTFECDRGATSIHQHYRDSAAEIGLDFYPPDPAQLDGYWSFAVVRDPIRRLVSAYSHRVVRQGQIADAWDRAKPARRAAFEADGIVRDPDPETFFARLDRYRAHFISIRHHTDPMSRFLGPDLAGYDCVARLENLDGLQRKLTQRTGQPIELPASHAVPPALRFEDLSPRTRARVRDFVQPDFDLLGDLYERQAA